MEGMTREEAVDWWLEWMRLSAAPGDAVALWRMFYDSDIRDVLGDDPRADARAQPGRRDGGGGEGVRGAHPRSTAGDDARLGAGTVMQEHPDAYMDAVERFARELHEEEAELESVLATVLFTDIVDSTARQAELGDRRWADLLQAHHALVRGCLARYRGRELDTAGDGFFAAFDGPARGIRCARAIVEGVRPLGLEVRAGLHTGECRSIEGKVGRSRSLDRGARHVARGPVGDPRLPDRARPRRGLGIELADRGEHELKGVPGSWSVYAVV